MGAWASWLGLFWMSVASGGLVGPPPSAAGGSKRPPVQAASSCPELFGGPKAHARNEHVREQDLDSIRQGAFTIDLTHTTDWDAPERIRFRGLELVDTRRTPERDRVALVRVEDDVGPVGCHPGLYRLRVDDSIGRNARVLAVLDDVVLLESGGELHYLKTQDASRPVFRMIWRASWKLLRTPEGKASTASSHRRPTRRRTTTRSKSRYRGRRH